MGLSKVERAAHNLKRDHVVSTKTVVETHHMCALKNWGKIVEMARGATVVFNMIDVGDYFDIAVQALCMKLGLLLIQGGTFCQ